MTSSHTIHRHKTIKSGIKSTLCVVNTRDTHGGSLSSLYSQKHKTIKYLYCCYCQRSRRTLSIKQRSRIYNGSVIYLEKYWSHTFLKERTCGTTNPPLQTEAMGFIAMSLLSLYAYDNM